MRQIFVLPGALALLVAQPLAAAETLPPLQPGKPAGVKAAQVHDLLPIYGGVIFFGALLAVTIGVSGSSASSQSEIQNATATANCCG
jgi:hypothetical protein